MRLISFLILSFFLTGHLFANIDPSSVKIKIYNIAVSTTPDCQNPLVVGSFGANGQEFDFLANPELINGFVPAGTYPCVILHMSDVIKFTPASTLGSCSTSSEYTIDVCRAGGAGNLSPVTVDATTKIMSFGVTTACTGTDMAPTDDKVPLFLSTSSTTTNGGGGGGDAFVRPDAGNWANGFRLLGAFVVGSSGGSGTFVINFDGQVNDMGGSCNLDPPVFGFR